MKLGALIDASGIPSEQLADANITTISDFAQESGRQTSHIFPMTGIVDYFLMKCIQRKECYPISDITLGINDNTGFYFATNYALGLNPYFCMSDRSFYWTTELEFLSGLTSENINIHFFVPSNVFTHPRACHTARELNAVLSNKDVLRNTTFIFGVYDQLPLEFSTRLRESIPSKKLRVFLLSSLLRRAYNL